MALVNLSDIFTEVKPEMPGCMDSVVLNAIRKAAIILCEKSGIYEVYLPSITTVAGTAEYNITQPTDQRVTRLSRVITPNGLINPTTENTMDNTNRSWRLITGNNVTAFIMVSPRTIRLYPIPTEIITIDLKATVKPSPASKVIEDYIYDDYYQGIAAGAKSILAAMPNKQWTNLSMVDYYNQIFNQSVIDAKFAKGRSFSNKKASIAMLNSWN